jgi:methylmalonyl-CoA mutase N-terminal domain/subunit
MKESADDLERIAQAEEHWRHDVLEPRVKRFNLEKSPTRFYTPTAARNFDFLKQVGFPGEYPFTAGNQPFDFWRAYAEAGAKMGMRPESGGGGAAGRYSGYGTTVTICCACNPSAAAADPTWPSTW